MPPSLRSGDGFGSTIPSAFSALHPSYIPPTSFRGSMRALVKAAPGPGMVLRDVPGSDVRPHRRADPRPPRRRLRHRPPHLGMGQLGQQPAQAAGRRSATSSPARSSQLGREAAAAGLLAVGDLVTAEGHIVCGHCLQCRLGAAHLCQRTQIIGVDRDGAFAEFIAMPASNVMQPRRHPHRDRRHHGPDGQRGPHRARGARCPAARCSCSAAARSAASRWAWRGPRARRW